MRFQVPQYIEVEDKIFGPLTFKQFIYIAGGIGVLVVLLTFLPKLLAILIGGPVVVFGFMLAFFKVNDKPFISVVEAFFKFTFGHKLYIWKKEEKRVTKAKEDDTKIVEQIFVPKLSESKLKDLTWSLDIKENNNPVTQNEESSKV